MNSLFLIRKAIHICFHKCKPDKVHEEKNWLSFAAKSLELFAQRSGSCAWL